jgi:hypothetical protein
VVFKNGVAEIRPLVEESFLEINRCSEFSGLEFSGLFESNFTETRTSVNSRSFEDYSFVEDNPNPGSRREHPAEGNAGEVQDHGAAVDD